MRGDKIINRIKKLYGLPTHSELLESYQKKNNIRLIQVLCDYGKKTEAYEIAKNILKKRLNLSDNFVVASLLDDETRKIEELSKRCHLCQSTDVFYAVPFVLANRGNTRIDFSKLFFTILANCITLPTIGAGILNIGTKTKYKTIELNLNLCEDCTRKHAKRKVIPSVPKELCRNNPQVQLYDTYGYDEIFWSSEFDN